MVPQSPIDAIAALQALLRRYPHVQYTATAKQLTIHPVTADGFEILLSVESQTYRVAFEGWHESYPDVGEALDVIGLGLSPTARLEVQYCGRAPHRWTLQVDRGGQWVSVSDVGLLFYPFWRSRRVRHLQNRLLQAA